MLYAAVYAVCGIASPAVRQLKPNSVRNGKHSLSICTRCPQVQCKAGVRELHNNCYVCYVLRVGLPPVYSGSSV